jgi:hypothetical protein
MDLVLMAKRMHSFSGDWRLIDTAPMDQDVTLLVTDGRGEPYCCVRLGQLWQRNAACGNALAVEAIRSPKETVTPRHSHALLLADLW